MTHLIVGRTVHHCAGLKLFGSNCRTTARLCKTHQIYCPEHGEAHLKKEPCPTCVYAERMQEQRAKKTELDIEKKKAKAEARGKEMKAKWKMGGSEETDKKKKKK